MLDPSTIKTAHQQFQDAAEGPWVTPCHRANLLSQQYGLEIYLKCDHLQATGSFKYRGAFNKILNLSPAARSRGVYAASTGNHGLGVARSAQVLGTRATIVVPSSASAMKRRAITAMSAEIVEVEGDCLVAEQWARATAAAVGACFISPYNDLEVMAGQGTIAVELLDQLDHLDALFVAVGGGGLIGGIGAYLKALKPEIQLVGCWAENAPILARCLDAGKIINVPEQETLADATAGSLEPGSVTLAVCQQVIDAQVFVSESAIAEAMRLLAQTEQYMVEGAAGLALAACLQESARFQGKKVAVLLCGRNVALSTFLQAVAQPVP